eukprot:151334-Chlamydomonas_euryale.AAC.1
MRLGRSRSESMAIFRKEVAPSSRWPCLGKRWPRPGRGSRTCAAKLESLVQCEPLAQPPRCHPPRSAPPPGCLPS